MRASLETMDRRQTGSALLLVGTIVLMCGLLLVGTTAYLGISSNRSEIAFEQARLRNAIDQGIATVLDQQRSVAWWDDAVLKIVKNFDDEFVDSEFGIYLTETYRHKAIFVLDGQDRPIYGFEAGRRLAPARLQSLRAQSELLVDQVRGRPGESLRPRADNFATRLDGYQQFTNMRSIASWSGAILTVDAMPAIVTAISISPNQNASLRSQEPYLLVSVVGIDQGYLDVVGNNLLLPNLRRTPMPEGAGALPLKTDDGRPLGYLSWTPAEPGRPVLRMVLPAMMLFVIGIGIFSIVMLRRLSSASHELRDRAAAAQAEALRDSLSQLPNRQAFSLAAEDIVRATDEGPHETVTIGYLDIDRFKDINDTLGHHMGDALIRAFAERLTQHLHEDDFLARVGGDEFAIIRKESAGSTKVGLEEAVQRAFDAPVSLDRRDITVTTSLGLARRPEHGRTVDELMRHADIALYEAKRQGRNRSIAFTPAMGAEFTERRELEALLKQALERREFELRFQPILDERTGRIGGAETLLRWVRSPRGAISPSQFIPVAEEAGLMPAIGEWVLQETVRQASRWPDIDLAVNLSPLQFRDSTLVSKLEALCAQHSVSPAALTLEITEGVLLEASDRTQSMLAELKRSGFKIALDDFGTGYSSLSYLTQFSFNKLKIDQCFVRDLGSNRNSRAIVQAIVQMGHGLGMEIVAEGVETEGELETLRSFRCDHIQGFLVARPMTAKAFEAFLARSETTFVDEQRRRAASNQRG